MKNFSLYRISSIVSMFIKFIFQIYIFNKKNKFWNKYTYKNWESLIRKQAEEYREKSIKFEGLMIKVGQFLSTRADILPQTFIDELGDLVDQVPAIPPKISKQVLADEWNTPIDGILMEMSEKPIASASIGDVYKGKLKNGEEVAIKIQRHNINKIIKMDFKALRIVLWIAQHFTSIGEKADLNTLYKEMVNTITDELDYEKELKNGQYFQKRYAEKQSIYIPHFYEEFSTKTVLVMEWIDGAKVTDLHFLNKNSIERKELAERLFHYFVEQLLETGTFHADPHQGNIIVKEDGSLVIIDFGMVGEIDVDDAKELQIMIKGFVFNDYDLIIDQFEKLGFLLPHADHQKLKHVIRYGTNAYFNGKLSSLDKEKLDSILNDLQNLVREQPIQLPAQYAFLGRAASIAIGVLTILDPHIDIIKLGKPIVEKRFKDVDEGEKVTPLQITSDIVKPIVSLPRNLNNWLETSNERQQTLGQKNWNLFDHQRKLSTIFFLYCLVVVSFVFLFLSTSMNNVSLQIFSVVFTVIVFVLAVVFTHSHYRWVKNERNK